MLKCETCHKESLDVQTLTLCEDCFERMTLALGMVIAENVVLERIIKNIILKETKKEVKDDAKD